MGSKKPSAWAKEKAAFREGLSGSGWMDDVFAREDQRMAGLAEERADHLRYKACESKNRYVSRAEAMETARECAAHGTHGLKAYKCSYCNGWHLTSHPQD